MMRILIISELLYPSPFISEFMGLMNFEVNPWGYPKYPIDPKVLAGTPNAKDTKQLLHFLICLQELKLVFGNTCTDTQTVGQTEVELVFRCIANTDEIILALGHCVSAFAFVIYKAGVHQFSSI